MENLAYAEYQKAVHDFETAEKKRKIEKFVGVGIGVAITFGLSVGAINTVHTANESYQQYQEDLKLNSAHPLVYDAGNVQDCKVQYIDTAHNIGDNTFIRDVYMKSDCDGKVSMNRLNMVKNHIQFNRMKLVNEETTSLSKPKK